MDDKEPGYYLAMQFSVAQGGSNWTTEAGPFATADAAIDATIAERDYERDYKRCTLARVDESGNSTGFIQSRERQASAATIPEDRPFPRRLSEGK